jgi:cytochrome c553
MKKYFIGVLDPADIDKVPRLLHQPSKELYETLRKFSSEWMDNKPL